MPDAMGICDGLGDESGDHCCWVAGVQCSHLVIDGPTGRRYACGLFTELGDWSLVHADPRYQASPGAVWAEKGVADCGPWFGCNKETLVAIQTRGSITEEEVVQYAQCCFKRVADTPQRARQTMRAINRYLKG